MKKLAVCIPTYNRGDAVEKLLASEYAVLCQRGIDLIFYDSSTDGETERLIQSRIAADGRHLRYRRVNSSLHSSRKVFQIYREMEGSDYDYIWMIHDHTVFDGAAADYICQVAETGADMLYLDMEGRDFDGKPVRELEKLGRDAWFFSRFGTAILKVETFLRGTDWSHYEEKYLNERLQNYSHVGYYLERAAELPGFTAWRLEFPRECFVNIYAGKPYNWKRESLRMATECWGGVIEALPEAYRDKPAIYRSINGNFCSVTTAADLKEQGAYGLGDYLRYRKWLKRLVPDRLGAFRRLAALPKCLARRYYIQWLKERLKRDESEELLIYGAGYHGGECAKRLEACGMDFDGFLVTKMEGNPTEWMGKPVYTASEYLQGKPAVIVIALSTRSAPEARRYLEGLSGGRRFRTLYTYEL